MVNALVVVALLYWYNGFSFHTSAKTDIHINKNMEQTQKEQVVDFARSIQWLGQATVKFIYQGQTIYIDPYQLKDSDKADIILITHDHTDHLSMPDIKKIAGAGTKLIVAKACEEKLKTEGYSNVQPVLPGETVKFSNLIIKAVPAYNVIKPMHKKSSNYVGYVMDFGGISVYHTGDTERITEMKQIRCDIILLPLGQTYTMNSVDEAVEAVLDTKATVAIPIHYGMYEGTKEDAMKFREKLTKRGIEVLWGK